VSTNINDLLSFNSQHKEVITIGVNENILAAAKQMKDLNIGFLLVNEEDNIVGVISERDIVFKSTYENKTPEEHRIGNIMTTSIIWGSPEEDLQKCLEKLKVGNFRHLPIRDEQKKIVGVIAERDITNYLLTNFKIKKAIPADLEIEADDKNEE